MNWKSLVAVLAMTTLCSALLFASGQSEKGSSTSSAAGQPIVLKYMTRFRAEEFGRKAWNDLATRYEALHPNVKIEFIDVTYQQMRQQILLRAQAGNPPNITEPVASWIPTLAGANILEPVKDHLSQSELNNYYPASLSDASYKGTIYGLPFWNGPILLFGNKALLQKVGFTGNSLGSIEQFRALVAKIGSLGSNSNGQQILGFSLRTDKSPNTAFWFVPWMWQYGGQVVDKNGQPALDSKGVQNAMEFYQWMTKNGYAAKGTDPYASRTVFAQGLAGFVFDGPWLRGMLRTISKSDSIDNMYDVFPMPTGVNGDQRTIANPTDLVVLKGTNNQKAAFDFLKYATSDPKTLQGLYEYQGLLPAVKSLASASYLNTPYAKVFVSQINNSVGVPWKNKNWPGVQDIMSKALTEAMSGGSVQQAAQGAESSFRQLLQ